MKKCINCGLVLIVIGALMTTPQPASAQQAGDIIGGFLGLVITAAAVKAAKKSWEEVDPAIKACLRETHGINPDQLANNAIKATDERVTPYIEDCQRRIEQERRQREAVAAAREAWAQIPQDVAECVRYRSGRTSFQFAGQGVSPEHPSARPYVERCRSEIAAARQREAAEAEEQARRAAAAAEQARREREMRIASLKARFPDDIVDGIMRGDVEIGWPREAVRESLGEPRQEMRTPDGTEMWIYPHLRIIFTNGVVTFVERA